MSRFSGVRLWPKSLYGQILLVVASALLVAQGINAAMLLAGTRNRAVAEATAFVVSRVANQIERQRERSGRFIIATPGNDISGNARRIRMAVIAINVNDERLILPRYSNEGDLAVRSAELLEQYGLTDVQIATASIKVLPNSLRKPLQNRAATLHLRRNNKMPQTAVIISARMPDGRWINAAGLIRPNEVGSIIALLLQTLTLYIAVMLPLALVARRIAKPLSKLTTRVQQIGLTDELTPLDSEGPSDIRQLIDAFNAMQRRMMALLGEKDVMLGAIGHDLKTPLAALRVRIESVEDDTERDKMAATIDEMVTILDDILTLARLGKSGEKSQRTDIGALVGAVAEEFSDAEMVEPGERVVANIRPVLLRRALRNLISNAIIYGKSASITVKVSGGRVLIAIEDTGQGIAPDLMDAMFEPFARAENSRSRSTGGSGLGLTIARAIARSHNGDVRLENRESGGLRAILELPLE